MKYVLYFLLLICLSCKNECFEISKTYKENIFIPNNHEVVDCKLWEDNFLVDGGKDEMIVLKISEKDAAKFIEENKLKIQVLEKDWDYGPNSFFFKMSNEKLNFPKNLNLKEVYYRSDTLNDEYSLECIFDKNTGYFIGHLGS